MGVSLSSASRSPPLQARSSPLTCPQCDAFASSSCGWIGFPIAPHFANLSPLTPPLQEKSSPHDSSDPPFAPIQMRATEDALKILAEDHGEPGGNRPPDQLTKEEI